MEVTEFIGRELVGRSTTLELVVLRIGCPPSHAALHMKLPPTNNVNYYGQSAGRTAFYKNVILNEWRS